MTEPGHTHGTSNAICYKLPPIDGLPFAPDEIKNPFAVTAVRNGSTNELLEFPRPVDLTKDSLYVEIIPSLNDGVNYQYSVALFLTAGTTCPEIYSINKLARLYANKS